MNRNELNWLITWIDNLIESLIELTQLNGYNVLLLTIPLAIIQGIITIFPFATLLLLHISTFGLLEGLFISWLIGSLASVVCFIFCRYLFYDWFAKRLGNRLVKYSKWQKYMDDYGIWVIIMLRTIPFAPNNVVSFMAAISPIRMKPYIIATTVGMLSHIWMLGLISSSIIIPDADLVLVWIAYIAFCVAMLAMFLHRVIRNKRFRAR